MQLNHTVFSLAEQSSKIRSEIITTLNASYVSVENKADIGR